MESDDDYEYDGSHYELLRARSAFLSGLALPAKVRLCSYLLAADALLLPVVAALPAPVRTAYAVGDPLSARLVLSWAAVGGGGVVFLAGVALAGLVRWRSRIGEPTHEQATWLVGVESMVSALGFVTGGTAVAVAVLGTAVGLLGVGTVDWLAARGVTPYRTGGAPPVAAVAAGAVLLAAVLVVLDRTVQE